jgi:hypothetical protein
LLNQRYTDLLSKSIFLSIAADIGLIRGPLGPDSGNNLASSFTSFSPGLDSLPGLFFSIPFPHPFSRLIKFMLSVVIIIGRRFDD